MLKKIEFKNIDISPIYFRSGVNLIVGTKKEDKLTTNNSVGKTLLISLIDHLLGAQRGGTFDFVELEKVSIIGTFLFDNKEVIIERYLVPHNKEEVNNVNILKNEFLILNSGNIGSVPVNKWTSFLGEIYVNNSFISFRSFNRMFFRKQDVETFKTAIKEDSTNTNWQRGKYNSYFLNLGYATVASNKQYTKKEKSVLKQIAPTLHKVIEHEDKESVIDEIQNDYTGITIQLKNLYEQNRLNRSKIKILKANINTINNISSQSFKDKFNVYKYELKHLIIKNYNETEEFHNSLISDNKNLMLDEINNLELNLFRNEQKIQELQINKEEFESQIKEYENQDIVMDATRELLSIFLGNQNINKIAEEADTVLKDETTQKLNEELKENMGKIEQYKKFLLTNTTKLYPDIVDIDFDIFINREGVFDLNFEFKGVKGEGKGTIRTLLYIFLLIDINQGGNIDYLILDSKVIDSIDIDVLDKLLSILSEYSKNKNIQIICAGNKQNFVKDNNYYKAAILSPENPLFGRELTDISPK